MGSKIAIAGDSRAAPVQSRTQGLVLLGFASPFFLNTSLGRIYPVEVLLAFMLPVLWVKRPRSERLDLIALFGVLWATGQILSDRVHHTPATFALAEVANIVSFVIGLLTLRILVDNLTALRGFAFGLAVGMLAATQIQPVPNFAEDSWKFGFAVPSALLLLALPNWASFRRNRRFAGIAVSMAFAAANLFLDFRSLALASIIVSLVLLVQPAADRRRSLSKVRTSRTPRRRTTIGRAVVLLTGLVVGITATLQLYVHLASAGALGEQAEIRFAAQSTGVYGLVLGARLEIVGMLFAIRDSPLLGAGANASLTATQFSESISFLLSAGYQLQAPEVMYLAQRPFPAHSAVLGAWFYAGIFSLPFWVFILLRVRTALARGTAKAGAPVIISVAAWGLAAIFFSPLGADQRLLLSFVLVSIFSLCAPSEHA